MLDLRLTFDITPAFAKAIGDIADALRGKPTSPYDIDPGFAKASRDITDALRGKLSAPESAEAVESDTVRVLEVSSHHTNQVVDGVLHIARSERAILRNFLCDLLGTYITYDLYTRVE